MASETGTSQSRSGLNARALKHSRSLLVPGIALMLAAALVTMFVHADSPASLKVTSTALLAAGFALLFAGGVKSLLFIGRKLSA